VFSLYILCLWLKHSFRPQFKRAFEFQTETNFIKLFCEKFNFSMNKLRRLSLAATVEVWMSYKDQCYQAFCEYFKLLRNKLECSLFFLILKKRLSYYLLVNATRTSIVSFCACNLHFWGIIWCFLLVDSAWSIL